MNPAIRLLVPVLLLLAFAAQAAPSSIHQVRIAADAGEVYRVLYRELESRRLFVVFEANIGGTLAGMAERLGEDYNRNGLSVIRSLVVCNAWYANRVSNLDPDMLALCPLRLSVIHKDGTTTIGFARPSVHAAGSAALPVIREIEDIVIEAMGATTKAFAR